jgi:hypothetical protein
MDQIDVERVAAFAKELSELSNTQAETLRTAAYIPISKEEWANYEKRRQRISELCTLLTEYRPL